MMTRQPGILGDLGVTDSGLQDLVVDLLNAMSAVRALSALDCEIVDEKTLIRQALRHLLQNQDIERCSFFTLDEDRTLRNVTGLSLIESGYVSDLNSDSLQFRLGEGILGQAAVTGQIQHCQDCRQDSRFAAPGNSADMPGSVICAPVFTLHKALVGVLNISHPQPNHFTDWHVRLLDLYSSVMGQLLTNRRLFQQMEIQIARRTAELERLVSETNALKEYYASMSMHDQLTGLHNRRYFYDQVEMAIAHHKRHRNPFCLLVMDIDHFKLVNDRYGHVCGDNVLIGVADLLKREVRNTDILVRFGGEEFVVIFTNTSCDNGQAFAERIRLGIKSLQWHFADEAVNLTMSIGIYCANATNQKQVQPLDIDQIIHCADTALYAAKANGRDRVEVYADCCAGEVPGA